MHFFSSHIQITKEDKKIKNKIGGIHSSSKSVVFHGYSMTQ